MTDLHPDDELLSAALDGEPGAVDVDTHVQSCETCRTRLASLRQVTRLVGEPPPLPPNVRREAAISAALDEWSRGRTIGDTPHRPPATDIRPHRPRSQFATRSLPLVAAAAGLFLLVGMIGLVGRSGDSTSVGSGVGVDESIESAADDTAGQVDDDDRSGVATGGARPDAAKTTVPDPATVAAPAGETGPLPELGVFDTIERLSDAVEREAVAAAATGSTGCESYAREEASAGDAAVAYSARITWKDVPAYAVAFGTSEDLQAVAVVRRSDCRGLAHGSI